MSFAVRRIRADEWRLVKDLRLDAVSDPAAPIAFLHSYEEESAHDDVFWLTRADGGSTGDAVAQFIAEAEGEWLGTLTVIRWAPGAVDHQGRAVTAPRGDVVGVFVRPQHRRNGIVDALFHAAADWAISLGDTHLTLDVHADNHRAQSAYRRVGFVATGETFTGPIGPEIVMERVLDANDRVQK